MRRCLGRRGCWNGGRLPAAGRSRGRHLQDVQVSAKERVPVCKSASGRRRWRGLLGLLGVWLALGICLGGVWERAKVRRLLLPVTGRDKADIVIERRVLRGHVWFEGRGVLKGKGSPSVGRANGSQEATVVKGQSRSAVTRPRQALNPPESFSAHQINVRCPIARGKMGGSRLFRDDAEAVVCWGQICLASRASSDWLPDS